MAIGRRQFIGTLAAGALLPGIGTRWMPSSTQAAQASAGFDVDALFDRSIVIDALSVPTAWDEAEFAALDRTGYTGIHVSLANRNFQIAERALNQWAGHFAAHPERLLLATTAADFERAKLEKKLAVLLGFQNGTILDSSIRNLDRLYALGTRCIQLTYNERNLLGDGCTERTNAGLSDFGVAAVEKMGELGILVDLSHCGEQTSADGITFSRKPPAFTHTMCKALHDHPRAKSDALLRAIAQKGGFIGMVALGYFVGPTADASVEDYLRHIDHAVKVAGIDQVGLSTDFQIRGIEAVTTRERWYVPRLTAFKPSYNVRWPPWIPELDAPGRFRTVAHGLVKRGYKARDIEKILGQNWLRCFRENFGS
jgi:membrane dipeptidase